MTVRQFFVFDPKVINEQKCQDDARRMILGGQESDVVIHKHKFADRCRFGIEDVDVDKVGQTVPFLNSLNCYRIGKATK
jgi:hypothetical protein